MNPLNLGRQNICIGDNWKPLFPSKYLLLGACFCYALFLFSDISSAQISTPAAYLEVSIPAESSVAVALPFDPILTNFYQDIQSQLGSDAYVLLWNASIQEYEVPTDNTDSPLSGDAFWVINAGTQNMQLNLAGWVSSAPRSVTVIPELTLVGNPSVSVITNNSFALTGDNITDPCLPEETSTMLPIGQGLWYSRNQPEAALIEFSSPIAGWPEQENSPTIIDISSDATGSVFIVAQSSPETEIALFVQSVPLDGVFRPLSWSLVDSQITDANGTALIQEYMGLNEIDPSIRCYMVVLAGTDWQSVLNSEYSEASSGLAEYSNDLLGAALDYETLSTNGIDAMNALSLNWVSNSIPGQVFVRSRVIYVSSRIGKDSYSGEKHIRLANDGPKKTVKSGLNVAQHGDTVVVMDGTYMEPVRIRPKDGLVRIEGLVRIAGAPNNKTIKSQDVTVTNQLGEIINSGE